MNELLIFKDFIVIMKQLIQLFLPITKNKLVQIFTYLYGLIISLNNLIVTIS